jgi:hypothetical protein
MLAMLASLRMAARGSGPALRAHLTFFTADPIEKYGRGGKTALFDRTGKHDVRSGKGLDVAPVRTFPSDVPQFQTNETPDWPALFKKGK